MMAIGWFDYTTAVVAIFASWSMYATLYGKPSPFRSWAESSFIGFTMGLNIVVTFWYVYNTGFEPITRGDWIPGVGIVLGILMVLRQKVSAFESGVPKPFPGAPRRFAPEGEREFTPLN